AERRKGGETGVKSVECLVDQAVWDAAERGVYDPKLLEAALARVKLPAAIKEKKLADFVPNPVLFVIDYADGLRANILTLNGAVGEWPTAWHYDDECFEATLFFTQQTPPFMHFRHIVHGTDEI